MTKRDWENYVDLNKRRRSVLTTTVLGDTVSVHSAADLVSVMSCGSQRRAMGGPLSFRGIWPLHDELGESEEAPVRTIDLNADASESFGNWTFGNDEAVFPLVSAVNTACGWHAGDPATIRNAVQMAKQFGTAIGAHPGFPDLMGFGRRMLEVTHEEVVDMVTYQVGALQAFAAQEGVRLNHVKPHAKLYVLIAHDEDLMCKVADAVLALQDDLVMYMLAGTPAENLKKRGYNTCAEVVVDMEYAHDGQVLLERRPGWKDPNVVVKRALQAVENHVITVDGTKLEYDIDTMCIHADRPNVVEVATAIGEAFKHEGITMQAPNSSHRIE